jgi:hypothetical protein
MAKIRDKFDKDIGDILEEANDKHRNFSKSGVPIFFWFIFLFFAYDDILRYIGSPILFYPLLFILMGILVVIALVGTAPLS